MNINKRMLPITIPVIFNIFNTILPGNNFISLIYYFFLTKQPLLIYECTCNHIYRAAIADGGKSDSQPPEPLPCFLIKLNIKN